MNAMNKTFAFTVAAAFGLGGVVGAFVLLARNPQTMAAGIERAPPGLDRNAVALSHRSVGQRQGVPVQGRPTAARR